MMKRGAAARTPLQGQSPPRQRQQQQQQRDDTFVARKSSHVSSKIAKADHDIWKETLAVCEVQEKLTIRSYYVSSRTSQRVWDEPPSGASHIEYATDVMRQMAEVQLQEMQIATGQVSDESAVKKKGGGGGAFGGFFRRNKDNRKKTPTAAAAASTSDKDSPKVHSRIQYKPDSLIGRAARSDEQLDPAMQQALAASMSPQQLTEEEQVELAMAMSLTQAVPTPPHSGAQAAGHAAYRQSG